MTSAISKIKRLQKQKDKAMKKIGKELDTLDKKRHALRRKQNAVEERFRQKALKIR